uniref:Uncharacterized protein n=1 Tax=Arundo donax TaxID=35708 RepID=A0A0A9B1F6_ARUDO
MTQQLVIKKFEFQRTNSNSKVALTVI